MAACRPLTRHDRAPRGLRPEGIVIGRGSTFFAGSMGDGALYRGDLRTGRGKTIFPGDGSPTVGLAIDTQERVYAAGRALGKGKVIDGRTGALLKVFSLGPEPSFINNMVVTPTDAWFTDSRRAVLYRMPLDGSSEPTTVPLTGDYVAHPAPEAPEAPPAAGHQAAPPAAHQGPSGGGHQGGPGPHLNGIEATADGSVLIGVQPSVGALYAIDPERDRKANRAG